MRLKILPFIAAMLLGSQLWAQNQKTITGTINDDTGQPLPGATIQVIPESKTVSSGRDGSFVIQYQSTNSKLKISFLGFKTKIFDLANIPQPLVVKLEMAESQSLNEIVVIGYETKQKKDISTAFDKVNTQNNTEGGYANFQQLIGGRAAGVSVLENSTDPGGGISVEIRGTNSLSFSTQPLYVVDGVPLYSPALDGLNNNETYLSGYGTSNPLTMLNPNDILSIDILKDAAATAIYGSRGSNGVVMITTKSGKAGKMKISFGVNRAQVSRQKEIKVLDARDYATFVNEAWSYRQQFGLAATTLLQPYLPNEIDSLKSYDHQKELARIAPTTDVNLSLSGGDLVNKFYISGQYYLQDGILPSTSLQRYNGKINYESKISSKLTFTANINYSTTLRNGQPSSTLTGKALSWAPSSPLINPDGGFNLNYSYYYGWGSAQYYDPNRGSVVYYNPRFPLSTVIGSVMNNPLAYSGTKGIQNANTSSQLLTNFGLSYNIANGLKVSGLLGITNYNSLLENYVPITLILSGSTQRGVASLGNSKNNNMLYQIQTNYTKTLGRDHNLSAVLVGSAETAVSKTQTASAEGFTSDLTSYNSIQSANSPGVPNSTYSASQLVSAVFRGSYDYKSKYYLSVSSRYDGSSKFADGQKFGFFPSVSGAWRVDQEGWFKKTEPVISELKLRASWGLVGNQAIDPYSTLTTLGVANVVFGTQVNTGFAPNRLANPQLQWEKSSSVNIGTDVSFFDNKFSLTVDLYNKFTDGLLFNVTPPLTSGYSTYTKNIASLTNKGIELSAEASILNKSSLKWNMEANIAFNRNVVNKLSGATGDYLDVSNVIGSAYLFRVQPGEPIGQFYGYKTIGVWTDKTILTKPVTFQPGVKEGTRRYADLNNDGVLDDQDRTYLGSALPKFFGGFSTDLTYKNLELVAFFSYSVGNKIFNFAQTSGMAGVNNIQQSVFDQRYRIITPGMTPDEVARITQNNNVTKVEVAGSALNPLESTDYYIEDGSFLRCRDITLSYLLPAKWLRIANMSSCKIYFNLQNPFTITKYSGYNPEVNTQNGLARGVDGGTTPAGKGFRFGFNVNF